MKLQELKDVANQGIGEKERFEIISNFFEHSPHYMGIIEFQDGVFHRIFCNQSLREHFAQEFGAEGSILMQANLNWRAPLEQCGRTGRTVHFEYERMTSKGMKIYSCALSHIGSRDEKSVGKFSFIVTDVTEARQNQRLLEDQQAMLVQSAKMSALGEMVSGMAHEINNPLAIIEGSIQLMQIQMELGMLSKETFATHTQKIANTVQRIAKIISSLRNFARDGRQDPMEESSLQKIVQDTIELCQARFINHDIRFDLDCAEDFKIMCRPIQIAQVLLNVLNNAFDAVEDLSEKWVQLQVKSMGQWICIAVTDSGLGIRDEIRDQMMKPFFTTKEPGKGTGLGLSLSKSLIENNGGELVYDSTSKHTSFQILLPLKSS